MLAYAQSYLAQSLRTTTAEVQDLLIPPSCPIIGYDRALRILKDDAPIRAFYSCRRIDVHYRDLHDNHSSIADGVSAVMRNDCF